jgi:hypothetical protein
LLLLEASVCALAVATRKRAKRATSISAVGQGRTRQRAVDRRKRRAGRGSGAERMAGQSRQGNGQTHGKGRRKRVAQRTGGTRGRAGRGAGRDEGRVGRTARAKEEGRKKADAPTLPSAGYVCARTHFALARVSARCARLQTGAYRPCSPDHTPLLLVVGRVHLPEEDVDRRP